MASRLREPPRVFVDSGAWIALAADSATSFVIMEKEQVRRAFTFDHHFATVGFQIVG